MISHIRNFALKKRAFFAYGLAFLIAAATSSADLTVLAFIVGTCFAISD